MKVLLDGLLPRLFPDLQFLCVPHEGKQDLERSIPRKLRAWREPGARFCVVRDNDGADCRRVKDAIVALCHEGRRDDCLVRIACQELEAWYFGAPDAIADAFDRDNIRGIGRRARYRDPDAIAQPSRALAKLVREFQKVSGARRMAQHLGRENSSHSYTTFIAGINRLADEILGLEGEV